MGTCVVKQLQISYNLICSASLPEFLQFNTLYFRQFLYCAGLPKGLPEKAEFAENAKILNNTPEFDDMAHDCYLVAFGSSSKLEKIRHRIFL